MNAMLVVIVGIAILIVGYIFYGGWLAKQWGVDDSKVTPAHELEDGMDYVPAKAPVLMGHHFSSIAGAGPINGPIQAAVFGWVPVVLWVLIGGIFFGAVHDYGALFASIRHKGQSLGEVVALNIGERAKKLFLTFSYLTLVLVVAAFASIVASTFQATYVDGVVDVAASGTNASVAMISLLFIIMAILFGFFVYRRGASLSVATIVGVIGIVICLAIGLKWHPIYLSNTAWMWIIGVYILIASVAPVWILLQPRDYLSSFLLYAMMVIAAVGVIGAGLTGADAAHMDMPAFTGAYDTIAPTGTSLGYVFPALFVTIACGAISGFHSLVGSGTTAKQLDHERDAKPIAYGGMLIECALALISLSAVSFIWNEYASGEIVTPTQVFATGISRMVASIPGLAGAQSTISSLLVLTVSVFCLTSLDTATRLARYMFQEFWLEPGQTYKDATGFKAILCNPFVATVITVVLGVGLGMTGYSKIWPLFGAANQLLAALALLTVCAWLGNIGRNNKMFYIPMAFMLVVTLTSLVQTITTQAGKIMAAGGMPLDKAGNFDWAPYAQSILGAALFVLAIVLAVEGCKTIFGKKKAA
ncbi:Carbon starvation protein A [uncultured Flavonifractor sp.]|jgi:carbon starvation protein|uniref:Carbon starvation protein A n=1 Tax=Flintibacter hominis TaxID=2763048 RepID=A0A8J6J8R5_9FIRM|nr:MULTISPECIES: carbon starvation CstA family protein [Eubacteriales]MBS5590270.1 carbon starvation protein A [Clostridiales bacterium]SCH46094.1 Carbon starvation protein A [uncultured Clostridium sp.]SCI57312.1 Carbon starvation protein A [uncultured Flavonifractor sp.]MBC5721728.1 carbon starvation protein A [Flintibacter hominis]MCH1979376.1 carbon starvation protein A [Lawsonibacter sp. OA9]